MSLNQRTSYIVAIIMNIALVISVFVALALSYQVRGMAMFTYYTQLSNLYGLIACLVCAICEIRYLMHGTELSRGVKLLKYSATCCLAMTFFVVLTILAPMVSASQGNGYYTLFLTGVLPVTHLVSPLLAFFSYVLFEYDRNMTLRESMVGVYPTIAYAAVAYPCNILRIWDGPYPFLKVLDMPLWMSILFFILLLVMALAICQGIRLLAKKLSRNSAPQ